MPERRDVTTRLKPLLTIAAITVAGILAEIAAVFWGLAKADWT